MFDLEAAGLIVMAIRENDCLMQEFLKGGNTECTDDSRGLEKMVPKQKSESK